MTETKISGAFGFDGGSYEDASGRIHCSHSTSVHVTYEAGTRLPSFRPGLGQGRRNGEGGRSQKKKWRRDRRTQQKNSAALELHYPLTRACGVAQLAEGRQKKISGHERRTLLGSA